jgi:uncharacterized protein YfbU (UPF0304 family)
MAKLNFTSEQRFILAVLCDLYRKPDERQLDPAIIMDAIVGGHDWALEWKYGAYLPEEVDSEEAVNFVADVLDMWRFLEDGYTLLSEDEKKSVKDAVPYLGDGPKFIGFDGNNETNYHSIALTMVDTLGRFEKFKGRDLNSHMPKIARYAQMLEKWKVIRPNLSDRGIVVDEFINILSRE